MAGGADRHRLLAPLGELEQCPLQIHFQTQPGDQTRFWQHLERDLGKYAKAPEAAGHQARQVVTDRKSTRLNSSHVKISYAVFCLKKKNNQSTTVPGRAA